MKALKIAQIVGVIMAGVGVGVGFNGGSYILTILGFAIYAGAKLATWVKSDKE